MDSGRVVETDVCESAPIPAADPKWVHWLEHRRIPFVSYPYEWSFSMLREATLLQLDLMCDALVDDLILKDATPFNVQFRGTQPVFIDVASFEAHSGGPWEGYRQFCQMNLYPLMLQAWRGIDFQPWLRGRLSGITPDECWRLLSSRDLFRGGAFSHVFLHSKLSGRVGESQSNIPESMRESGFQRSLIEANVSKLRKIVAGLQWRPRQSYWSEYDVAAPPVQSDAAAKEEFVQSVCATQHWGTVWDLGCNVGRYSRIAADHADYVLALDIDHLAIDRLFDSLQKEQRQNILPLVFNLADPSPALGWRGRERKPLTRRGTPNLVFCLALIHHLVLRENLLLPDVVDWLAQLGATLIIEFVDKSDPQARSLLANRDDQYDDYSAGQFTACLEEHFIIRERQLLPSGTRTLFLATPKRDRLESTAVS
ncbi:MAG: class I SAM-dependent methyltransferase [Planctomycetaceae bacterium]|nr:class I SAM-dependent methyltransferase [Planctomycetaceae bacterium]